MAEPITVTEAAEFLRLDTTSSPIDEQETVSSLITAARQAAEDFLNRSVTDQERVQVYDFFQPIIMLPYGDVIGITSIEYVDVNGDTQTVDDWILSEDRLTPAYNETWPDTRNQIGAVTITYQAGFNGDIPASIIRAIYLMIGNMYDHRSELIVGASVDINPTVKSLLMPYRIAMGV